MSPEEDAALAARLQAEFDNEVTINEEQRPPPTAPMTTSMVPPPPIVYDPYPSRYNTTRTNDNHNRSQEEKDLEYARRIHQEMADAELARTLASTEASASTTAPGAVIVPGQSIGDEFRQLQQEQNSHSKFSKGKKIACSALFIIIGVLALLYALGINIPFLSKRINNYFDGDDFWGHIDETVENPWSDMEPNTIVKWRHTVLPSYSSQTASLSQEDNSDNNKLSLTIINALEDSWIMYLEQAMEEWDNGTPDVLNLQMIPAKDGYDFDCIPENNAIKVCNGNYGNTQWRGINELLLSNNYIIASAARMNDYFLYKANNAQKQYTMCHELGHGFGLSHTDENFLNEDTGNCMDYTIHPKENQSPSYINFNALNKLYGSTTSSSTTNSTTATDNNNNRRQQEQQQHYQNVQQWPNWLDSKIKEARQLYLQEDERRHLSTNDNNTQSITIDSNNDWKILHTGANGGELQEIDLGEGYKMRIHLLS